MDENKSKALNAALSQIEKVNPEACIGQGGAGFAKGQTFNPYALVISHRTGRLSRNNGSRRSGIGDKIVLRVCGGVARASQSA